MSTMHNVYKSREVNLHTHSFYCGHGSGQLEDYVAEAKKGSITLLGFSEHAPLPNNLHSRSRMDYSELETYLGECRSLQEAEDSIEILAGFECDNLQEWNEYYRDLKDSRKVDYLCGGVHFVDDTYVPYLNPERRFLYDYVDDYVDMLRSGIYDYAVHPDLYCAFYRDWDKEALQVAKAIIESAQEHQIPLEINGNGLRKGKVKTPQGMRYPYPRREFWELVSAYDVKVIANSDSHHPYELYQQREEVYAFAQECNIELGDITMNGRSIKIGWF